jgi:hypothetical protein
MHVSQLSGARLDCWVHRAEERYGETRERGRGAATDARHDSKDEKLARPIMEREGIVVNYIMDRKSGGKSLAWVRPTHMCEVPLLGRMGWLGDDDLEAAMRCYVAITFGNEIPD